jgi:MFS transporter, FHS family, glucose/mannose:H+ symporter
MLSSSGSSPSPNPRFEWPLLHASFILIGVITTLLGPVLPSFSRHWSLSDAQAGFFFASQYFGSFLGVLLTSPLLPRFGFAKVTGAGFLSFLLGFAFLGVGPWMFAAFLVGVYGLGYGLSNPAINLRATQLPSANTAAAVTFLNFSWSLGAVSCPFLVGFLLPAIGIRGISAGVAAFSLLFCILHFLRPSERSAAVPARATHSLEEWLNHLRHPSAVALFLLYFFYVGTEVALGGWSAMQEKRIAGVHGSALSMAPSFFYGFLLIGRGVAPLALQRISQLAISVGGLLCATLGGAVIVGARTPAALYLGAALAGFGLAPQYPILVTWLAAIFGEDANWLGALFFGAAGLGGAFEPWLVGIVADQTHSLRAGLAIPLIVSMAMVFLALRVRPTPVVAQS